VQYALHLAAGFGSQIAFTLTRRIPGALDRIDSKPHYQKWLDEVSGYDSAELEVVKRNLRIVAKGNPQRPAAPSNWEYGTEPVVRTKLGEEVAGGKWQVTSSPMVTALAPQPERRPIPALVNAEPVVGNGGVKPKLIINEPLANGPLTRQFEAPAPVVPIPVAPAIVAPVVAAPVIAEVVAVELTPPVTPTAATDPVADRVLAIVSEQTGYPIDMLELDLDLQADLGVDTIKQAETFLAIRQAFDIPRQENLQLRDYPTLAHVIDFAKQMRPDLVPTPQPITVSEPVASPVAETSGSSNGVAPVETSDPIRERVLAIVAEQTGYPTDMLELDLDLQADLGVDTIKQAETMLAIRQAFDIPRQENLHLRDYPTLAHVINFVEEMRPDLKG
jgi:acyl carrier protein